MKKTLFLSAILATALCSTTMAAVTTWDLTTEEGYNTEAGYLLLGTTKGTTNGTTKTLDFSADQTWSTNWCYVFSVNASSIGEKEKLTLAGIVLKKDSAVGYAEGLKLTDTDTKLHMTSWSGADLPSTQNMSLTSVTNVTFVISHTAGGVLTMSAYDSNGDFSTALASAQLTGQNFTNYSLAGITLGGTSMGKFSSGYNNTTFEDNADIGDFQLTNAGYSFGSVASARDLVTYSYGEHTAVTLTWNGTTDNHVWNTSAKTWTDSDATFMHFDNVIFGADAASKEVTVGGYLSTGSMTVQDDYVFDMLGTGCIHTDSLSITDGKSVELKNGSLYVTNAITSFSGKILGENAALHLNMANTAEATDDGRIMLAEGSTISDVYVDSGVFALNLRNEAMSCNLRGANLHINAGTFLIRNGVDTGELAPAKDVYLSGDNIFRVYSGVGKETELTTNFLKEQGAATATLKRTDGGTITLKGNIELDSFYFAGGTTILGEDNTTTVNQIRLSENGQGHLTVAEGAVLNVIGATNKHSTSDSIVLSHWGQNSILTVEGSLNAEKATVLTSWTGTGTLKVSGGTANVKGVNFYAQDARSQGDYRGSLVLENSGRINLGADGIKDAAGTSSITLGNGTIGATADWQSALRANATGSATAEGSKNNTLVKITLSGAEGTIFDTTDAKDEKTGRTITLNNGLTGSGKLVVRGAGSLVLNAEGDRTGSTLLESGTLEVNHSAALGNGAVTIAGGKLAINADVAMNALTQTGGTIQVNSGKTLTLSGAATYTGTVFTDNIARTTDNGFGTTKTYVNAITGPGSVNNSATWTLNGTSANYDNGKVSYTTTNTQYYINKAESDNITENASVLNLHQSVSVSNSQFTVTDFTDVDANTIVSLTSTTIDTDHLWLHKGSVMNLGANSIVTVDNLTITGGSISAAGTAVMGENNNAGFIKATQLTDTDITANGTLVRGYTMNGGTLTITKAKTAVNTYLSATTNLVVKDEASATFGQTDVTVGSLTLGNDATLTLGTSVSHDNDLTTTALTVDGYATMCANLVVNEGTMTFYADSILTMGCDVTIGDGVKVYITGDIASIRNGSETVTIIDGLTSLSEAHYTEGKQSIYVNGDQQSDFYLSTVESEYGGYKIVVAPEPATATLSLLALAALAARRKRH